MQKFLVCPVPGGASLTFAAVKYLIKTCGEGIDPLFQYMNEHPGEHVAESDGQIGYPGEGLYSPLLTEWWKQFKRRRADAAGLTFAGLVSDNSTLSFLWAEAADIRKMLVPFVERLEGRYAMLDLMNNNVPLRVVDVPDGFCCGVTEDSETGCEFVEEYPRLWHARSDDEYKFIAQVKKFITRDASKQDWYEEGKVYDIGTVDGKVMLVLSGKYGAARCVNGEGDVKYLFLKKNEYYRATEEHPERVIFEINNLVESRFTPNYTFVDAKEAVAYAKLVVLLEDDAKDGGKA